MTDITIQSLATAEAEPYAFVDEEYLSAAGKRQILADWQRFITGGFKKLFFTRELYRFLRHNCGFTAHTSQDGFWAYYFNAELLRLQAWLNQFGGNRRSVEFNTHAWLGGPAADLKLAMCQEMTRLYAPLSQVLEDLAVKHAELGRAWREFALASGLPDPGYPPHYLVSENARNLLAYAAYIALHKPQPLQGLQRQFPLLPAAEETGLYVARAA
jgi:hypothetical protein